jgi:DNA-binding transcriptional ArsR family regulator
MRVGTGYFAALVSLVGLLILASALLTPTPVTADHMGTGTTTSSVYPIGNVIAAILGSFMFTFGFFFFMQGDERRISLPRPFAVANVTVSHLRSKPVDETNSVSEDEVQHPGTDKPEENQLILRLLSGDERIIFRTLMDSGGETLQKEIIVKTKMSDAKVSRTIDRLEEKGLISKARYGVTNKIKIEIEA